MIMYCDYVASGRALTSIENYIQEQVLPTYANTHTDISATGRFTGALREQARDIIASSCGVNRDTHAVVFTGSGATGALDVLLRMLPPPFAVHSNHEDTLKDSERAVVIYGPYEHHSNILPWRHSNAICCMAKPHPVTGLDLACLVPPTAPRLLFLLPLFSSYLL